MTNAELMKLFTETYPEVAVSDYRPLSLEFIKDKEGITIWTENGDIIQWFPNKMAIEALSIDVVRCKDCKWSDWYTTADGHIYCYCMETGNGGRTENDYCSYGERGDSE